MSNHQYKTAPNFTTVTHANTMLGRFNIRNSAPALCLDIPFHKKRKLSLTPEAGRQPWRNYCPAMCHDQPEILTHARVHIHMHTRTHVIPLLTNIHSLYRHTEAYTPSLGFVADSTSVLKISILYFSLCHPEKHWLFSKNNLSSFLSQSSSPPHFSLYLHDFNVAFLRSKRVHPMPQPLLRPTLKYKIVIHTILLIIYTLLRQSLPPFCFQLLPF